MLKKGLWVDRRDCLQHLRRWPTRAGSYSDKKHRIVEMDDKDHKHRDSS